MRSGLVCDPLRQFARRRAAVLARPAISIIVLLRSMKRGCIHFARIAGREKLERLEDFAQNLRAQPTTLRCRYRRNLSPIHVAILDGF
jgi:hypothetical protein